MLLLVNARSWKGDLGRRIPGEQRNLLNGREQFLQESRGSERATRDPRFVHTVDELFGRHWRSNIEEWIYIRTMMRGSTATRLDVHEGAVPQQQVEDFQY